MGVVVSCLLLPTGSFGSATCAGDQAIPTARTSSVAAGALVCDINAIRAQEGLGTLRWDARLQMVSRALAVDMARSGNFSHVDSAGRDLAARVAVTGYLPPSVPGTVLETIAWGEGDLATPSSILDAWLGSDAHRQRLLDPHVTDVAVASANGDGVYYVADFGTTACKPRLRSRCGRSRW